MDAPPTENWMLGWALRARQVAHGAVMAGLLVDLAADHRQVHLAHTVRFPIDPAARALRVQPAAVRLALHQLAKARLVHFQTEDHPDDGPHVTVTLLHPPPPLA
ncbi:hypothetical protein AB0N07_02230 [Streptomyces sp. NPDC051172]|uniref:hypothetical protein n=1 Tax=Streptomyces sp. NPDC051172 TaxID=3155796 RepID=UPI003429DFF1